MGEIKDLKKQNSRGLKGLLSRVSGLEQYSRMNGLIVNGLETMHRSCANVTAGENRQPSEKEQLSLEQQVFAFFETRV